MWLFCLLLLVCGSYFYVRVWNTLIPIILNSLCGDWNTLVPIILTAFLFLLLLDLNPIPLSATLLWWGLVEGYKLLGLRSWGVGGSFTIVILVSFLYSLLWRKQRVNRSLWNLLTAAEVWFGLQSQLWPSKKGILLTMLFYCFKCMLSLIIFLIFLGPPFLRCLPFASCSCICKDILKARDVSTGLKLRIGDVWTLVYGMTSGLAPIIFIWFPLFPFPVILLISGLVISSWMANGILILISPLMDQFTINNIKAIPRSFSSHLILILYSGPYHTLALSL